MKKSFIPTPKDITDEMILKNAKKQIELYLTYPKLKENVREQLALIEASQPDSIYTYYPCSVEMINGRNIENVIFFDVDKYIKRGGVLIPKATSIDTEYNLDDVKRIYPSKNRLPIKLSKKIYSYGETGMGYLRFYFVFRNGEKRLVQCGAVKEFFDLPSNYLLSDIVGVEPFDKYKNEAKKPSIMHCTFFKFEFRSSEQKPNSGNEFFELA